MNTAKRGRNRIKGSKNSTKKNDTVIRSPKDLIKAETTSSPSVINSETDYNKVMDKIDSLMAKGSKHVNKDELAEIRHLALAAQAYERNKYVIEPPTTLTGIIEMKMYEMRLKQKELAQRLHITDAKLSLIMSGKQKPDVAFLKAVHQELHVDANLLLDAV